MKKFIKILVAVLMAFLMTSVLAQPANAVSVQKVKPTNVAVVGKQMIITILYAERRGSTMRLNYVASSARNPYRISSVEIFRYKYAGSRGAVRSYVVYPWIIHINHRVNLGRTIPARTPGTGWSGFVRVTFISNGETRAVNMML